MRGSDFLQGDETVGGKEAAEQTDNQTADEQDIGGRARPLGRTRCLLGNTSLGRETCLGHSHPVAGSDAAQDHECDARYEFEDCHRPGTEALSLST